MERLRLLAEARFVEPTPVAQLRATRPAPHVAHRRPTLRVLAVAASILVAVLVAGLLAVLKPVAVERVGTEPGPKVTTTSSVATSLPSPAPGGEATPEVRRVGEILGAGEVLEWETLPGCGWRATYGDGKTAMPVAELSIGLAPDLGDQRVKDKGLGRVLLPGRNSLRSRASTLRSSGQAIRSWPSLVCATGRSFSFNSTFGAGTKLIRQWLCTRRWRCR